MFNPREGVGSQYPFIKRIIGLPGETVEIKNGQVFIDNTPINEPYVFPEPPRANTEFGPQTMGDDQYSVLGDNRNNSNDSRAWGPISRSDIIGKARFVYWPPGKWGPIDHYSYP